MRIRRGLPEDAAAIAALTRAAYAKWVAVIGREPLPMQVDYAQAVLRNRFDLIELDGALVGLIETTPDGDHLLIVNLAVSPAHQGLGLGQRLLDHAQELASQSGFAGLRLYANRLLKQNIGFYSRRGFAVEREAALNGGIAVYMTKRI